MLNKLRILGLRGRIGFLRGQGLIKELLLRVNWKFNKNLDPRGGSPTMFILNFPRLARIGCLTLGPKGRTLNSPSEKPTCTEYGKKHMGECLVGTSNCFGCGKSSHKCRGKESNESKKMILVSMLLR